MQGKSLKYFQGDLLEFNTFMNEHGIKKEDVLHVNSFLNYGHVVIICFYWE